MQYRTFYFRDSDVGCAQPFSILNVNETYTVLGDAPGHPTAKKIDYQTRGTTLVATDAAIAEYWSGIGYCGYTSWDVNVAKDVTNRTCSESGNDSEYWPIGHVYHDIYQVLDGRFYMGDPRTGTGTSDGTRPTQLGTSYFTKQ